MVIEVKKWKYTRPSHVPEGQREFTYTCGCKEYEEDSIWFLKRCPGHKAETDALIEGLRERIRHTT